MGSTDAARRAGMDAVLFSTTEIEDVIIDGQAIIDINMRRRRSRPCEAEAQAPAAPRRLLLSCPRVADKYLSSNMDFSNIIHHEIDHNICGYLLDLCLSIGIPYGAH